MGADLLDDAEAVEVAHPDVEEDEVGARLADRLDRLPAARRLADDLDVGVDLEQPPQPAAGEGRIRIRTDDGDVTLRERD